MADHAEEAWFARDTIDHHRALNILCQLEFCLREHHQLDVGRIAAMRVK